LKKWVEWQPRFAKKWTPPDQNNPPPVFELKERKDTTGWKRHLNNGTQEKLNDQKKRPRNKFEPPWKRKKTTPHPPWLNKIWPKNRIDLPSPWFFEMTCGKPKPTNETKREPWYLTPRKKKKKLKKLNNQEERKDLFPLTLKNWTLLTDSPKKNIERKPYKKGKTPSNCVHQKTMNGKPHEPTPPRKIKKIWLLHDPPKHQMERRRPLNMRNPRDVNETKEKKKNKKKKTKFE